MYVCVCVYIYIQYCINVDSALFWQLAFKFYCVSFVPSHNDAVIDRWINYICK